MNTMFEEVIEKAKDIAYVASKKTGEVVEVSKLKLKCVQINGKIKGAYEKLGSAVYNMNKNGYKNDELVDAVCEEVDELLFELDKISSELETIKNVIICPTCGKKNPTTSYFCSKCGSRISEEFTSEYSDVIADYDDEEDEKDN